MNHDSPAPPQERYELKTLLGSGGMGQVWLAVDRELGRTVAIKFIRQQTHEALERFRREAKALALIRHPNVLEIYDLTAIRGQPCLVCEPVDGTSLDAVSLPLQGSRILDIAIEIARGLQAVHAQDILHRDITPRNVMLTRSGQVKLVDFGLARHGVQPTRHVAPGSSADAEEGAEEDAPVTLDPDETQVPDGAAQTPADGPRPLTATGQAIGTPAFMAPEAWRGDYDHRSELYSLAAVLYQLATGRPPHLAAGSLAELERKVRETDARPLNDLASHLQPALSGLIDRCLRRDPEQRPDSAEAVLLELEQLREASPDSGDNPYRGLFRFEQQHARMFVGRETDIEQILGRLKEKQAMVVFGTSGVGKSSLCLAGVLPRVAAGALGRDTDIRCMRPGDHPVQALAAVIAGDLGVSPDEAIDALTQDSVAVAKRVAEPGEERAGVLLFIDQLEELVTRSDGEQAERFSGFLAGALAVTDTRLRILASVRSDFLESLTHWSGIRALLGRDYYLLMPLTAPEDRRRIIEEPARLRGVDFESDELVAELMATSGTGTGSLPLLQFALHKLWLARDRKRNLITADSLVQIGGLEGALARHADSALARCTDTEREAARFILTRLVDARGTSRSRPGSDLVDDDPVRERVLHVLVEDRLVVTREAESDGAQSEAGYELAHESLVQHWSTLRDWLDTGRERRALLEECERATAAWERLDRSDDELWGAARLARLAAFEVQDADLGAREAEFVRRSRRFLGRSRRRRIAVVLVVLLVALGTFGLLEYRAALALDRTIAGHRDRAETQLSSAREAAQNATSVRAQAIARMEAGTRADGEGLWAESRARAQQALGDYAGASNELETALLIDARPALRRLLAEVVLERAAVAEDLFDYPLRDELLAKARLFSPEKADELASVVFDVPPQNRGLVLRRYQRSDSGAMSVSEVYRGPLNKSPLWLRHGSYVAEIDVPGKPLLRYPFLLKPGQAHRAELSYYGNLRIPEGYVFVPPGSFLYGSDQPESIRRDMLAVEPMHETQGTGFLIGVHEVTLGEWLTFVRSQPPEKQPGYLPDLDNDIARFQVLRDEQGRFAFRFQIEQVSLSAAEGERVRYDECASRAGLGRAEADWLRFPVAAVSFEQAEEYAAWLDQTHRLPGARLCTEREWEQAARGADRRLFPHGDRVLPDDTNHDMTYDRDDYCYGPDEVGSHPASNSPYGVADMAGNVWEMLADVDEDGKRVSRGGCWYIVSSVGMIPNRDVLTESWVGEVLGFRICAD